MAGWVRLCDIADAPPEGQVAEFEAVGRAVCLARIGGELSALDNICPHRQGPLGQGWVEDNAVICPWHSWAFDVKTGESEYPEGHRVEVLALRTEQAELQVLLESE